jgi:alpha-amylase
MKPDALLVGEVYDITLISSSYVPAAVDLTFDFELASQTLLAARTGDAGSLAIAQRNVLERYPAHQYAAFLTNHDQTRVSSEVREPAAVRATASLLLTGPGVPFMYYGEEVGLSGSKPDERIRTPMPWTPDGPSAGFTSGTPWESLEDGWPTTNVAAETADGSSLLSHYRRLIALRGEHPALRFGSFVPLESASDGVYAFLASESGDTVAVIVNLGSKPVRDLALSADGAGPCVGAKATLVYGDGVPAGTAVQPPAASGIRDWRPLPDLPAHATVIVSLGT